MNGTTEDFFCVQMILNDNQDIAVSLKLSYFKIQNELLTTFINFTVKDVCSYAFFSLDCGNHWTTCTSISKMILLMQIMFTSSIESNEAS